MGLWDDLLRHQAQSTWVWDGSRYERLTYGDTFLCARRVADSLRSQGVGPGSMVAAVITNSHASVAGFLGAWWAGATVASLPIPARGQDLAGYVAQLRRLCHSLEAQCLMIEKRFAEILGQTGLGPPPPVLDYESLVDGGEPGDITPPPEDQAVLIQYSSGTTAEPRGAELTGRAIEAQLARLADRLAIDPGGDIGLMWLPMSHDMGFFGGTLFAWYTGMRGILSPPERFLTQPWTWFEDCADLQATVTVGPPFAYAVAARTAKDRALPGPLALRLCLVGGEPIAMSHLTSCVEAFQPYDLSLSGFTAAYGLAEATLAVSTGNVEAEPGLLWVDGDALVSGELSFADPNGSSAREVVSCGRVLDGFDVVPSGTVGELRVRGPSLARGYWGQPALSAERFAEGAFSTGDLGFVNDGEVYVIGRTDDRLIVGGRNVDVADLEQEIYEDPQVRTGNCAIVDLRSDQGQRIVLVAEVSPGTEPGDLLPRVRRVAARRQGLRIDDVVLLGRGEFPKTPSGKAQRYRCRQIAAAGRR